MLAGVAKREPQPGKRVSVCFGKSDRLRSEGEREGWQRQEDAVREM